MDGGEFNLTAQLLENLHSQDMHAQWFEDIFEHVGDLVEDFGKYKATMNGTKMRVKLKNNHC